MPTTNGRDDLLTYVPSSEVLWTIKPRPYGSAPINKSKALPIDPRIGRTLDNDLKHSFWDPGDVPTLREMDKIPT